MTEKFIREAIAYLKRKLADLERGGEAFLRAYDVDGLDEQLVCSLLAEGVNRFIVHDGLSAAALVELEEVNGKLEAEVSPWLPGLTRSLTLYASLENASSFPTQMQKVLRTIASSKGQICSGVNKFDKNDGDAA